MSRTRKLLGVEARRCGYTWIELVVVVAVLAVLLGIGIPALLHVTESARRASCVNNLKQIGLAFHNYVNYHMVFPQGTISSTGPIMPQNQYDVWSEATQTTAGGHGTSFLLRIWPWFCTSDYKKWNYTGGVGFNAGSQTAPGPPATDFTRYAQCYCPARRTSLRPGDSAMMLASWWPGGGTDYGVCVGRHVAYDTSSPSHNVLDAGAANAIAFDPSGTYQVSKDDAARRWGIFGRVNVSTSFRDIRDGTSNTIMTGELQRITVADAQHGGANNMSHDGWAVGGDATGFTTGYGGPGVPINGQPTPLMNNGFFQSPGSDHAGGANFGMADGSVRFLNTSSDPNIFALLGSMADREPCVPDDG